jgi:hypothetical protein
MTGMGRRFFQRAAACDCTGLSLVLIAVTAALLIHSLLTLVAQ